MADFYFSAVSGTLLNPILERKKKWKDFEGHLDDSEIKQDFINR